MFENTGVRGLWILVQLRNNLFVREEGEKPDAAQEKHDTPRPAPAQVMQRIPETTQAKHSAEERDDEGAGAKRLEKIIRDPRAGGADQVVGLLIVVRLVRRDVFGDE